MPIPGSEQGATIRNIFVVAILSVVTLGIYVFFWWYFVNREMADLGRARGTNELGTSPGTSLLAITLGALVIVPAIMSIIGTFRRVQATQRLTASSEPINGWIAFPTRAQVMRYLEEQPALSHGQAAGPPAGASPRPRS